MPVITRGIHKQLVCVCACVCVCVSACMYYKPKLPLKNALGVTLTLSRLKPCPRPVFISGITLRQTTWNTAATKSGCCKTFLTSLSVANFHGNNCIVLECRQWPEVYLAVACHTGWSGGRLPSETTHHSLCCFPSPHSLVCIIKKTLAFRFVQT